MKSTGKIFAAAFCGAMAATVQAASAAGAFSPPGQVVYSYTTPAASIYGAIQVGGAPSSKVTQASAANLAVIGQVGMTPTASIKQTGQFNALTLTQVGTVSASALTIQFGGGVE